MTDDVYTTAVRIDASPADVFPYLIDAELVIRWMGDWANLQAEPGGTLAIDINGVPIRGEYLVVEPPHRVVFTWGAAGSEVLAPGSTTVEIWLRPDGAGTLLELVHRDLPPEELADHGVGWTHFLDRLVIAAVGGEPGRDPWADP
ncbi:MAG TPA: SRPBCC family protein [Acidimicrobiales bacterium]|nr:SRPBCC family protein [Acidimicrobiales bacterium]